MRLLIGLSGGADSVALLRRLCSRREQDPSLQLFAVHVNHGMRGAESDADEAFTVRLCEALQVPLNRFRLQPPPDAGEGWARQERYRVFRQAYEACQADALVLAHHRDDQAETVLEHLLRGAGPAGLGGMRPETMINGMKVLRPLLNESREQLRKQLTALGQDWREDSSNAGDAYLRNRVRHHLLPLMDELAPGIAERLCRTAAIAASESDALEQLAMEWLTEHPGTAIPIEPLQALPEALACRVLRAWLRQEAGLAPDYEHTRALCRLPEMKNGASVSLGGTWVRRGWTHLHWLSPSSPEEVIRPLPLTGPGSYAIGQASIVCRPGKGRGEGLLEQGLPLTLPPGCVLRTRQPGDRIRPWGQTGSQSLQDYFVNRRVDAPFRDRVPLLCRGSEVLWVAGIGGGALEPIQPEQPVLMLCLQGCHPWTEGRNERYGKNR